MVFDTEYHREKVRELAQEPPDEPTHCELKQEFACATKSEKSELVKDIASFANTPLEHHGGYGYLIFGVSQDGDIPGISESLGGDPPSEIRNLLNGYLERPVGFEFVTTHVEVNDQKRRLAAVIIPNSRCRPHVISKERQDQKDKKTKFLLRKGEVWLRKAGGRQLATAEDIDAMYEAKFLSTARDAAEPLERRIQALENELAELRSASPVPSLGIALPGEREPTQEASARPANEVLFTESEFEDLVAELDWAKKQAERERRQRGAGNMWNLPTSMDGSPSPQEYMEYRRNLEDWLYQLGDFVMVEIALSNTGEVPAENVYVEIEIPPELAARQELPGEKPERPTDTFVRNMKTLSPAYTLSKRNAPDDFLGPDFDHERRLATWEIGRLYHGRPVRTDSDEEYVNGLLLGRESFERLARERGFVDLTYMIRAANLRQPVEGKLRLLPAPKDK